MGKSSLSFYARKKLNHRFTQGDFLEPRQFIKFLKEHKIDITEKTLERYEKEGWLPPVFRIIISDQLQKSTLFLGIEGIKAFHKDGFIEFPKKGDYEPWSNFKHDYKKGERHDKKLMFYHPFQLIQVLHIIQSKKFSFTYYDSDTKKDIEKRVSAIKKWRNLRRKNFKTATDDLTQKIGFLMLLEEPYKFHAFGSMSIMHLKRGSNFTSWARWKNKTFSPKKLIQQHGLTIGDIEKMYENIGLRGHFIDPLDHWYDLTRIMRPSILNRLKGESLTAQFYYHMARMIAYLYYDLTKKILKEPDMFFDGSDGKWKKNIYSDPFDYATKKTQRGIIRFFVRDPTTRIFLLVEGDTEERIIGEIFAKLDVSMTDDGINVINCKGVANIEEKKLRGIIQTANQDHTSMYIIADNENKSKRKVEKIKSQIHSDFGSHVWRKSFEEDNFEKSKVVALVNSYLKKYGESLSGKEIRTQQKPGKALVKSIEDAYGKKYRKNLYRVIRKKKSDFSSELMKPRIKKISRSKKVGSPSEIEKVLDEVFKMVPNWG